MRGPAGTGERPKCMPAHCGNGGPVPERFRRFLDSEGELRAGDAVGPKRYAGLAATVAAKPSDKERLWRAT